MYLLFLETKTTEEEYKSAEDFRQRIADKVYEYETGMPAISQYMRPADAM